MKRRDIIKGLTLLPFTGGIAAAPLNTALASTGNGETGLAEKGLAGIGQDVLNPGPHIYQSIGVEPFVNCKGTNTIMGGSVARDEVRLAMESAALYNVQLDELAMGVGKRLSELTGAEWGMVSAGCAAGLKLVTAACLSGGDPEKLIRIPNLTGFSKDEVIIPASSRNVYDHAIRNSGVKIIMVNTAEELRKAINSRTAMIYMIAESKEPLTVETVSKIAGPLNVPLLVDAAAHVLTFPDVHLAKGASVVAYSGGKGIKGPGCSGLLLGRKDILMSAWQASSPHHGFGRDNKLGREEHVGMLAAVEAFAKMDHVAEMKTWVLWLNNIAARAAKVKGVKTEVNTPDKNLLHHVTPNLLISWDPEELHVTGEEVAEELGTVSPRVGVGVGRTEAGKTGISLVGYMMSPGNDKVAGDRIYEVLSRKRGPKPVVTMKAPSANITGRWDVSVEFFNSKSEQQFFIEKQDGNWLQGNHKAEFSLRELSGTIEGNEVKFQSQYIVPGDRITSIFFGTVNGDNMSGNMDMGEYITARFTAKRHTYRKEHSVIAVPNGRPQSS